MLARSKLTLVFLVFIPVIVSRADARMSKQVYTIAYRIRITWKF